VGVVLVTTVGYLALAYLFRYLCDSYAAHCCAADKNHTMRHYLALDEENKNEYVNILTSMVNVVIALSLLTVSANTCDPPSRQDDVLFGNTFVQNTYCIDHPTLPALCSIMYFLGYITYDSIWMGATFTDSKTGRQELVHHIIGFTGCFMNILVGKYMTTLGAFSLINEISSIFNNIRKLLSIHQNKGLMYTVNGVAFTLSFLLCRVIF